MMLYQQMRPLTLNNLFNCHIKMFEDVTENVENWSQLKIFYVSFF